MERIAKYYLCSEAVVLVGIFFSGFYDPSFWLWGVCFVGLSIVFIGLVISIVWSFKDGRLGKSVILPVTAMLLNTALLFLMVIWVEYIFSGGLHFLM